MGRTSVKANRYSSSATLLAFQNHATAERPRPSKQPKVALLPIAAPRLLMASSHTRYWASSSSRALTKHAYNTLPEISDSPSSLDIQAAPLQHRTQRISRSRMSEQQRQGTGCCPFLHFVLFPLTADIWCPLSRFIFYMKCCYWFVFDSSNGKFSFADQLWRGTTVQFPRQQIWQIATVPTQNLLGSTEELQRVMDKVLYTR